jgi:hypothetical protein
MGAENLDPLGFDSWNVQHVATRYTDYAIPTHKEWEKTDFNEYEKI